MAKQTDEASKELGDFRELLARRRAQRPRSMLDAKTPAEPGQKLVDAAVLELTAITGQKPVITRAKKAIATFKLRENMPIGTMVTLRRERMWEFLDRLVTLALPRVRDFRGTSPKAFDGAGNYTLGLKEQIVFPEIDFDRVEKTKGMNITFVTTAETDEEAKELLASLGMPFRS